MADKKVISKEHEVLIAGGGPTGLTLAAELALAGVDVAIVERRNSQELAGSRAAGLHSRTIEVFDQRGIADRFICQGELHRAGMTFRHSPLDPSILPSRHNYFLGLWQPQVERVLADWVGEFNVPIYRGEEVTDFTQDDECVHVSTSCKSTFRAKYLVACDGGRSLIRKKAGIPFPGFDATKSWLIAEAQMREEPKWGLREDDTGTHAIAKLDEGRAMRVVLTEQQLKVGGEPTLADVSEALVAVFGTDFGVHTPTSIARFTDVTRQASSYRSGRVLLAGDAAHVHPPMGGQGLNIGVQDAMNLGWKLAQVVRGISPETFLDTYQSERHSVAERVLRDTMAHVALQRQDERIKALGDVLADILRSDEVRRRLAVENAGLGIQYEPKGGHPLVGRRMPDLELTTANGAVRVYELLHSAKAIMLNLGARGSVDLASWGNRVHLVEAEYQGEWQVPLIGDVAAPAAILVRPDGYVAWVPDEAHPTPIDALSRWFGSVSQKFPEIR